MASYEPGAALPELRVTPDRFVTVRYAGASGDYNPIHIDEEFAKSVGLPGRILHGLWSMAQVARAQTEAAGGPDKLRRLSVQFRAWACWSRSRGDEHRAVGGGWCRCGGHRGGAGRDADRAQRGGGAPRRLSAPSGRASSTARGGRVQSAGSVTAGSVAFAGGARGDTSPAPPARGASPVRRGAFARHARGVDAPAATPRKRSRADAVRWPAAALRRVPARSLSFGQDPRWRAALVDAIRVGRRRSRARRCDRHGHGRGCARAPLRLPRRRARPERADARRRCARGLRAIPRWRRGSIWPREAEALPFATASFDALTFTYLLRYVDDPGATLRELARVVKPGGTSRWSSSACRRSRVLRRCGGSTRASACRARPRCCRATGTRSAASSARASRASTARYPLPPLVALWEAAGLARRARAADELRRRRRDAAASAPLSARLERPAFYALRGGGWRDLVTLLHPPYTAWHLSYVALGAAAA